MMLILACLLAGVLSALGIWLTDWPWWAVVPGALVASVLGLIVFGWFADLYDRCAERRGSASRSSAGGGLEVPEVPPGLKCSSCGGESLAFIIYGEVGPSEELRAAVKAKRVTLGGCLVSEDSPQWCCNSCGERFGSLKTGEG